MHKVHQENTKERLGMLKPEIEFIRRKVMVFLKKQLEENYSMAWYELLRGRYDYFSSRGTVKMM